ncbi:hypothetical protein Nepgr_032881 [Nepenthes gracilis]|uniref:FAS1 domain-containing protein n=1 Tax=Nepenthes gracilis TaxID=150966 RepID=A0AAD3TJG9_NEPGR|nr:hypothetical protein Nepgr_032881 [Nepenthes gracilis]
MTPSSSPSPATTLRPSPPLVIRETQLNNIIEALIGAGDFGNWANLLSAADPSIIPISATLFIPADDAVSVDPIRSRSSPLLTFDPFVFPYHIVPQRLTFSDLQLFPVNSRLPTLLPGKSLLITNSSLSNFTIDDSPITHPNFYLNSAVSVQGIGAMFDYTLYGNGSVSASGSGSSSGQNGSKQQPSPTGESRPPLLPGAEIGGAALRSDAACFCSEFPIVLSVACSVFVLKMQKFSISR